MIYRLLIDGEPTYYNMKAVKPTSFDDHHIVIGISNVNDQITREDGLNIHKVLSFSSIALALSQDYFSIYYVNTLTDRFIEYSADEMYHALHIGQNGDDFFDLSRKNFIRVAHPDDVEMFLEAFTKKNILAARAENRTFTLTYRLLFDGKPTYVHMKVTAMPDKSDPHIVIGISKIDAQMRREMEFSRVLRLANRDALTGVKSMNAYVEEEHRIDEEIASGTVSPFAVLVCDLNRLKEINDTRGHNAGDQYIKNACAVICRIFKHSPVFRVGGDEFAVLLYGSDFESREELLEQIRESACCGEEYPVIASGLAEYIPGVDNSLSSVFDRADAAMYGNKKIQRGE